MLTHHFFSVRIRLTVNKTTTNLMIESVKSFKVGDKVFGTFEEAQREALISIICSVPNNLTPAGIAALAHLLIERQEELFEILRATPNSMRREKSVRKPRSDKGVPRKKTLSEMDAPGMVVEGSGKYAGK